MTWLLRRKMTSTYVPIKYSIPEIDKRVDIDDSADNV